MFTRTVPDMTDRDTPADADPLITDPDGGMPRLREIMRRLRNPDTGCPWDAVQTFDTIAPYTIEEAYEVADAIARSDMADLCDELGDLQLQVVYHAQMAEEAGTFSLDDVVRVIADKMVRRHPHVFGDQSRDKTADQQTRDWEQIKAAERDGKTGTPTSALDGVAVTLPPMTRAVKLQKRASRVGFDWASAEKVLDKIAEEAAEVVSAPTPEARKEELGDLLFVLANLARHLDIDPEEALRGANAKFERRFHGIEAALAAEDRGPADATLEEMDALWTRMKLIERGELS